MRNRGNRQGGGGVRTAALRRVSTERQEMARQTGMIEGWCEREGVRIAAEDWYEDDGISGRSKAVKGSVEEKWKGHYLGLLTLDELWQEGMERKGFVRLLVGVREGVYGRVVLASLDRLSRDMVELLLVVKMITVWWRCELVVVDMGGVVDLESTSGLMMVATKAMLAEFECVMTAERTRDALAAKRARGVKLGRPPAGWTVNGEGSGFVPGEDWGTMVRVVAARRAGCTQWETVRALGRVGVTLGQRAVGRWLESYERRRGGAFAWSKSDDEGAWTEDERQEWGEICGGVRSENGRLPTKGGGFEGEISDTEEG